MPVQQSGFNRPQHNFTASVRQLFKSKLPFGYGNLVNSGTGRALQPEDKRTYLVAPSKARPPILLNPLKCRCLAPHSPLHSLNSAATRPLRTSREAVEQNISNFRCGHANVGLSGKATAGKHLFSCFLNNHLVDFNESLKQDFANSRPSLAILTSQDGILEHQCQFSHFLKNTVWSGGPPKNMATRYVRLNLRPAYKSKGVSKQFAVGSHDES